jgi:hypothetical protein
MIASTSTLPKSTFFSDFGSETLRSAFSGRRESLRLFNATPPAIPAIAAPPASKGVFAFEASSATLPPAFETEPFDEVVLLEAVDRLVARGLLRALDPLLDRPDREDEPFPEPEFLERLEELLPLLDFVELERLRLDRLLEDRVVWAMGLSPHLASLPAAPFAPAGPSGPTR